VANNNYPQITSVTSEQLQAKIRDLLPSQEGFGTDLMAQNVIVPIIDLTAAAQGTSTPESYAQAINFGGATTFSVVNTTTSIITTAGFYRIIGTANFTNQSASNPASIRMSDGFSTKDVWNTAINGAYSVQFAGYSFDFIVFNASGITTSAHSGMSGVNITGSVRQIADSNGNAVLPTGFSPQ
jgi:hypothetical protein